jgi:hypothetical protein
VSETKLKTAKPFDISKWKVLEAFEKVKANAGGRVQGSGV